MAEYIPASLYWGQPFEASVVNGNFTKLSEVLNSTVSDYSNVQGRNIRNDRLSLDFSSFRRNTVTESFRSADLRAGGASGDEIFMVSITGSDPTTTPWGSWKNDCDSVGTGLRFYLRDAADVQFASQINLRRMKTSHAFGSSSSSPEEGRITKETLQVTAKLVIDGVVQATIERDIYMAAASGPAKATKYRGLSISFNHIETGMAAGAHTVHVNLTFDPGVLETTSGAGAAALSPYSIIQIKGGGGTTCATAFYK